jgi:branched-chain amino acid transport system ATP-binding protein
VSVIGPNGAGKSTLLLTLASVLKPSGGSASFEGRDISKSSPEALVRLGMSLVPEGRHIFARLTVGENLRIGSTSRGRDPGIRRSMERVLELFPVLGDRLSQSAGQLSGGEQQMLAIARALLARPRLLMLDEPSLGLAPAVVDSVLATLEALRTEDGVTILLVEQNMARAIHLADRTYVLRSGVIEHSGVRDALMSSEAQLERAYFGFSRVDEN